LNRLDFIKIDVEGAEHLVFRGALKTLKRLRPAIIFERNPESCENVVETLRATDYSFLDLQEKPLGQNIQQWPTNILAVSRA
jgi:hypothetical protein